MGVSDYWTPALADRTTYSRPDAGTLIAYDRAPHRVIEARDVPAIDWPDEYRDAWVTSGMPDPWWRAPYYLILQPHPHGKRRHLLVPGERRLALLPEHYAVCAVCGELSPCREITSQRSAEQVMERVEKLTRIMPGCCWGCGEPITSRQAVHAFPGDNLLMPTAPPDPVFHARSSCRSSAASYESLWVLADPSRPRSLLTLTCTGSVTVHGDGSAECVGAIDSDCPDVRAAHRSYSACFALSRGCPRECAREGHPGTRFRRRR